MLKSRGCGVEFIENPKPWTKFERNERLSSDTVAEASEAIQLKPQHIKLRLRPKQDYSFTLTYRQAVDYPVDCYYLMDLSSTMREHRDLLAKVGNQLVAQMRGLTKNFRIGFGSFVDKTVLPFSDPAK